MTGRGLNPSGPMNRGQWQVNHPRCVKLALFALEIGLPAGCDCPACVMYRVILGLSDAQKTG